MKTFLLALLVAASAAAQVAPRISIRTPQISTVTEGLVFACSGCGCRGGGGYRLPNGKCAPKGR
jgi:hypothetical protein